MSSVALKPRKRLRHEILSLAPLVVLTAALFFAFPFDSLRLSGRSRSAVRTSAATCVYVELTAEQESKAVDFIRSAISTDVGSIRDLRADLSLSTIPERPTPAVLGFADRKRPLEMSVPDLEILSLPATVAAPSPGMIPAGESPACEPAFPQEELLKPID